MKWVSGYVPRNLDWPKSPECHPIIRANEDSTRRSPRVRAWLLTRAFPCFVGHWAREADCGPRGGGDSRRDQHVLATCHSRYRSATPRNCVFDVTSVGQRKYVFDVTFIGQRQSPWPCDSVKVEIKFHLTCKLHFLRAHPSNEFSSVQFQCLLSDERSLVIPPYLTIFHTLPPHPSSHVYTIRLVVMVEWLKIARPTRDKLYSKLYSNISVHISCMGSLCPALPFVHFNVVFVFPTPRLCRTAVVRVHPDYPVVPGAADNHDLLPWHAVDRADGCWRTQRAIGRPATRHPQVHHEQRVSTARVRHWRQQAGLRQTALHVLRWVARVFGSFIPPGPGFLSSRNFPANPFPNMRRGLHQNVLVAVFGAGRKILVYFRVNSCSLRAQKSWRRISRIFD